VSGAAEQPPTRERGPFPGLVVLGVTGGIAVGKSLLVSEFQRLGAVCLNADDLGREVVQPGEPALAELAAAFGPDVVQADGCLDRGEMARLAFSDPGNLSALNAITHPRIEARIRTRLEALAADPPRPPIVVLEAAVLRSAGWERLVDKTLLVKAKQTTQMARLTAEDRMAPAAARACIQAQEATEKNGRPADWTVSGELNPAQRREQVAAVWLDLLRHAAHQ